MGTPKDDARELTWWDQLKLWLTYALVILVVLLLIAMIFEGTVMNFDCSFTDFIRFKCWRYGFGLGK